MDKLDTRLLRELMAHSRIPLTHLAKKLNVSREVVTYRLERLKKEAIILDFVTEINIERMGYKAAAIFVNIKASHHNQFEDFLNRCPFVSWVAELSGVWSFGFSIVGTTNDELDARFLHIYNLFKSDILDHRFTLHRKSTFFFEKYFGSPTKHKQKKDMVYYMLDGKDKIILQQLAQNSRIDVVRLSSLISLTAPAVAQRIRNLQAAGYIEKYSLFVNLRKLGILQYSVFVINKNIDEKELLLKYLHSHRNVSFIAQYLGDPFIEFGLFVSDPYELREKLQEIEEKFPANRIIEISLFQKEFVSVGPPRCVFE